MELQVRDIINQLGVENKDDGEKIFNFIISMFAYIKVGDSIQTPLIDFTKVDTNFMMIQTKIEPEDITDSLEKAKIIKFLG